MSAYGHQAGEQIECGALALELRKDEVMDQYGNVSHRVGFKIGGGIDQDPTQSPFNYPDTGIYITYIEPDSPAQKTGLRQHDKLLRVNGHDYTMLTHDHAVRYIKKYPVLELVVARTDIGR